MNRMKEFCALQQELERTPAELEYSVTRARARAKSRRRLRLAGIPAGSVAALFAAFVLLVNFSMPFALACSGLPILGDLAAAVDWSGSLKAAVDHQYVQPIGQSRTESGVTLTVEYVIVDQRQLNIFYSVCADDPALTLGGVGCTLPNRQDYSIVQMAPAGDLSCLSVDFVCGDMPGTLDALFQVSLTENGQSRIAELFFSLTFDPAFTASGESLSIDRWIELDGQHLYLDRLEIYPTHARLIVSTDEGNTAWLKDLDFYLEDGDGVRYEQEGGLGGYSDPETGEVIDRRTASPWFAKRDELTLHITGAQWLRKDAPDVAVDLKKRTASGLPEGAVLEGVEQQAGETVAVFRIPAPQWQPLSSLFEMEYARPDGESGFLQSIGMGREDAESAYLRLNLGHYRWDSVVLRLTRTATTLLTQPISFPIR